MKDDAISRQRVLKLLSTIPPEEAMTKAMLIQSVKQMDAAQPEKHTEERTEKHACDCISRQAAIERATKDHDFYKGATTPADMARGDELLNVMCWLGELPSAQPETADCIYCHEDSDGYVKPIEKNCHALIRFGMNGWEISLSAKGWNGSAKIMYCPMCGRRLNE